MAIGGAIAIIHAVLANTNVPIAGFGCNELVIRNYRNSAYLKFTLERDVAGVVASPGELDIFHGRSSFIGEVDNFEFTAVSQWDGVPMVSVREYTDLRRLLWDNRKGDSLSDATAVGVMLVHPPKPGDTVLVFSQQALLILTGTLPQAQIVVLGRVSGWGLAPRA
ncbi:hypothetical protein FNAPI_3426 [Fusarium napiforme]|uniref:Polyketide synthase n=1 Tax=Fusarium napiforme TaxID=42672 RepID=A0A8H5NE52_9HYPO|nr:hypothetical protein FNAPI_3426 [Fusarium napiforme]